VDDPPPFACTHRPERQTSFLTRSQAVGSLAQTVAASSRPAILVQALSVLGAFMIKISDEMREHINNALANGLPCLVATTSQDGWPHISPKGSVMVYDDTHLAYWERTKRATLDNIKHNPKVTVYYRDPATRQNYRFYGVATVHGDDPVRKAVGDRVVPLERQRDPDWKGLAVLIEVTKITNLAGETLQED